MRSGKKPCGCHISRIGHLPASIVYCRMHEQAESLLRRSRSALGPLTQDDNEECLTLVADLDAALRR